MTNSSVSSNEGLHARLAGFFYLVTIASGIFAEFYTRSQIIVFDNAAKTAANIAASLPLYRLGIAADMLMTVSYIAVVYFLFALFKSSQEGWSRIAAYFGLTGCIILAVNLLNAVAPMVIIGNVDAFSGFSSAQLNDLIYLFVKLFSRGYTISLLFFGVYCLLIGKIVMTSNSLPKIVGALMALAGLSYVVSSLFTLVLPQYRDFNDYLLPICLLGEAALTLWLLIMGVKIPKAA